MKSLRATVHRIRPDLVPSPGDGEVIPPDPPQTLKEDIASMFMLAKDWDTRNNPKGWYTEKITGWSVVYLDRLMSRRLQGVRAFWDGHQLYSKQGRKLKAPAFFFQNWPKVELDGELTYERLYR